MGQVLEWFDREPTLRVAVITGAGDKAFCAGQDLIELGKIGSGAVERDVAKQRHPLGGFGGISRRMGKKPIIAAVNGVALGGGFEIVLGWYVLPFLCFNSMPERLREARGVVALTPFTATS